MVSISPFVFVELLMCSVRLLQLSDGLFQKNAMGRWWITGEVGNERKIKARLGNLANRVEKTKTDQSVCGTAFLHL